MNHLKRLLFFSLKSLRDPKSVFTRLSYFKIIGQQFIPGYCLGDGNSVNAECCKGEKWAGHPA
jgi:hypothetical protein